VLAALLADALLEGVPLADGVGVGGRVVAEDAAEILEVGLRRRAFR